jgi:alpha/beta superfamily hydrolase
VNALAWQACEVLVAAPSDPPGSTLKLEARRLDASAARGLAVVAAPHPLYGGTMHNPVVGGIAEGLARAGVASLVFNWRGIDGSEGARTDSLEAAVADYLAAIERIADSGLPLYAAGYSFGAAVALLAACEDPRVRGVIMLAPPAGMLRAQDVASATASLSIMVGDHDEFAAVADLQSKLNGRSEATLDVIAGADHFFHYGGLPEIPSRVSALLERWQR